MLFFIHCEIKLFFHRSIFSHHLCSEIMNPLNVIAELRIKEVKSSNKSFFSHALCVKDVCHTCTKKNLEKY